MSYEVAAAPAAVLLSGGMLAAGRDPEEFLHTYKFIAPILDYDLPFIPVVMVLSPIRTGMCALLSRSAVRMAGRQRRSPRTAAVDVVPADPGTLLPGR